MDSEEFIRRSTAGLQLGLRLKKRLRELGRTRGRHRCPEPHTDSREHYISVALVGPKSHLRMSCDDPACIMQMME